MNLIGKLCFALFMSSSLVAIARPAKTTTVEREWTLLVFMNGNNNLDRFGTLNLKQMERVGSTDKVNVVVQWASLRNRDVRRLLIQKNESGKNEVTSPVIENMGDVDMGDVKSLEEFLAWGVKNFPARHYLVDVWNHGSGWHAAGSGVRTLSGVHAMDISYDDNTGHAITTKQLGEALSSMSRDIGHKVDIYGSDACLMGMIEVATELSKSVSYYLGSQELEPGEGWPYDLILTDMSALDNASPKAVSEIVTKRFAQSYLENEEGDKDITFSALDLDQGVALRAALDAFAAAVQQMRPAELLAVAKAAEESQAFYYEDYRDLADFADVLATKAIPGIDPYLPGELRQAVDAMVVANATGPTYARAHGVSIWLPTIAGTYDAYAEIYKTLDFDLFTGWSRMLQLLAR